MGFFKKWNFGFVKNTAEQGDREKQLQLGNYYYEGEIVERSYSEAARWFAEAARYDTRKMDLDEYEKLRSKRSRAYAFEKLAKCFRDGTGVKQNEALAMICFCSALTNSDAIQDKTAEQFKASVFQEGKNLMAKLLEKAFSDIKIQYQIGEACQIHGCTRFLPESMKSADSYGNTTRIEFLKNAFENGYADAAGYIYKYFFYNVKDYAAALKWLRAGTERGGIYSQMELGDQYSIGSEELNIKKDKQEAVRWYMKAYAHENVPMENMRTFRRAASEMGSYYEHIKDYAQAVKCYERAVKKPYIYDPSDYVDSNDLYSLGKIYKIMGRLSESKKMLQIGAEYYGDLWCKQALEGQWI